MTNGDGKSDDLVVPEKSSNKEGTTPSAETMEERRSTKGKTQHQTRDRAQNRTHSLQQAVERIREFVDRNPQEKLTTLWHHVYRVEHLEDAFFSLKTGAAPGVDGVTWSDYLEDLDEKVEDLSDRLKRGAYRAKPTRREYIPKPDGRQRPLGIPALEDKVVQKATTEVLTPIFEKDFLGFSYGFRPGRGPHDALDALYVGIMKKKVNWVLDADIRGFFDAIDHEWLIKFVEHRISDQRVIRHIKKWLKAGILEDNEWRKQEEGTPQGGIISPLLANVYLHYVFDLWAHQWRQRRTNGDVIIVRYADDFVVGFQYQSDAKRFMEELVERFAKFNLELHSDKTRLIEFGRYAEERRKRRGDGKPETFDFLGFTHICGENSRGSFMVLRKTVGKRLRRKLKEIYRALKRRMHHPVPVIGKWLSRVLVGYFRYHAVPTNLDRLKAFRDHVLQMWRTVLLRKSDKARASGARMKRLRAKYLPRPKIYHEWPIERFERKHLR